MAPNKKNACRLNAIIAFIDETGLLMAPLVRRSWSPLGSTPVIHQRTRSHKKASMIAALCVVPAKDDIHLYFRLHADANINAKRVLRFLRSLLRQSNQPVIIIWDRLRAHRAKKVQAVIIDTPGASNFFLPPYAPELNPVEHVWSYLKMNPLANFTPQDLDSLSSAARHYARSIQRKPKLLFSFLNHSPLFFSSE